MGIGGSQAYIKIVSGPSGTPTRTAAPDRPRAGAVSFGTSQFHKSRFRAPGSKPRCPYREKTPTGLAALVQRSVFRAGAVCFGRLKNHEGKGVEIAGEATPALAI